MDLPTLIKNTVASLGTFHNQFYAAKDPQQQNEAFNNFVTATSNLHKISKGSNMSDNVRKGLEDIVKKAAEDAQKMKEAKNTSPTTGGNQNGGPVTHKSGGSHSPVSTSNKDGEKDKPKTDNDKDKAAFQEALQGAIVSEKPNVKWEDVAGLKIAKQTLKEAIIFPTKFPDIFVGLRKPWKGILLYGVS
jgi:vacuolar protein-sorting-associated protein 4